jgi:formylglycine-generating enzyme required for sulfatase activity
MKLVRIPTGEFLMGAEEPAEEVARKGNNPQSKPEFFKTEYPQHRVRITKPFYMGAYEVTQGQYEMVMGENPARFKAEGNPVEQATWNDAVEFCRRLSQKEGVEYRLPAEAEWEYAYRAGTTTPFYTGTTIWTDQANYNGNCTYGNGYKGEFRAKTTPVGSFLPNGFGLYDMCGNVFEWCRDWYGENYYGSSPGCDPTGPDSGSARVLRGGCWDDYPSRCRASLRSGIEPSFRYDRIGFRVAAPAGGVR